MPVHWNLLLVINEPKKVPIVTPSKAKPKVTTAKKNIQPSKALQKHCWDHGMSNLRTLMGTNGAQIPTLTATEIGLSLALKGQCSMGCKCTKTHGTLKQDTAKQVHKFLDLSGV
jgi:hypothetical protein